MLSMTDIYRATLCIHGAERAVSRWPPVRLSVWSYVIDLSPVYTIASTSLRLQMEAVYETAWHSLAQASRGLSADCCTSSSFVYLLIVAVVLFISAMLLIVYTVL